MAKPKARFYVVWAGRQPGVYDNWTAASEQVNGFGRAKFKSFLSREEAESAFRESYWKYAG